MTDCPVIPVTCDRCDYRLVRDTDQTAKAICGLCANYNGGGEE